MKSKNEVLKDTRLLNLRRFNLIMGGLHFIQGIMMLVLSLTLDKIKDFKPIIYGTFLSFDATKEILINETNELFTLPFGIMVSLFLFLSSIFHFIISFSKRANDKYNAQLNKHYNAFRWIEYSLSSSLMIVCIAVLFGINDLFMLILIFFLNASMNLFGLLMEKININRDKVDWSPFICGSIVGIIPWIIIFVIGFTKSNIEAIPSFVIAILFSYLILFNLFPINMYLQYKKIGKWKDYLYGEKMYIILSLVAKTLLAWLVLFGVMQPS